MAGEGVQRTHPGDPAIRSGSRNLQTRPHASRLTLHDRLRGTFGGREGSAGIAASCGRTGGGVASAHSGQRSHAASTGGSGPATGYR